MGANARLESDKRARAPVERQLVLPFLKETVLLFTVLNRGIYRAWTHIIFNLYTPEHYTKPIRY